MSSADDQGKGFGGLSGLSGSKPAAKETTQQPESRAKTPEIPDAWREQKQAPAQSQTAQPKRRGIGVLFGIVAGLSALVALGQFLANKPEATRAASTPSNQPSPSTTTALPTAPPGVATNCRSIDYNFTTNGRPVTGRIYSYVKDGVRHYTSKMPHEDCDFVHRNSAKAEEVVGRQQVAAANDRSTAPNGNRWPTRAAYVHGYPVRNADGHSQVTVDNTQNNSPVFVKLVALSGNNISPVRQFYIPAGSQFTMQKVRAGRYDVRYMNLNNGSMSRSEAFAVEEHEVGNGIEYSTFSLTLYKVQGGNMQTHTIGADEF
jgi:hypothetical protein